MIRAGYALEFKSLGIHLNWKSTGGGREAHFYARGSFWVHLGHLGHLDFGIYLKLNKIEEADHTRIVLYTWLFLPN